uniref:Uncharacterized protein n=1 Tax=Glossina pallidipes TaxID=7398 RepID=A0A1A9ZMC4_GLOPL
MSDHNSNGLLFDIKGSKMTLIWLSLPFLKLVNKQICILYWANRFRTSLTVTAEMRNLSNGDSKAKRSELVQLSSYWKTNFRPYAHVRSGQNELKLHSSSNEMQNMISQAIPQYSVTPSLWKFVKSEPEGLINQSNC